MSEQANPDSIKHRSSRKIALLLSEINKTIRTIEANGQAGSVAHQRLIAQKISLMGLNSKPKAPDAEPAQAEGAGDKATYHPWPEWLDPKYPDELKPRQFRTNQQPTTFPGKKWCSLCRLFVWDCQVNSIEPDPALLPAVWERHQKLCHGSAFTSSRGDILQ